MVTFTPIKRLVTPRRIAPVVALFVLVGALVPACAAACCFTQSAGARLMASMPCCAPVGSMNAAASRHANDDATLVKRAPASVAPVAAVLSVAAATFPTFADGGRIIPVAAGHDSAALFLRNAQLRI